MCRWNALHPYNAVHVAEIAQRLDKNALATSIAVALHKVGFSEIVLDSENEPSSFSFSPAANAGVEIEFLSDAEPETLHREIERQLNTPFVCG